jgi:hypothetical protein
VWHSNINIPCNVPHQVGFWLSLATGVAAGLLTVVQLIINQKYDVEQEYRTLLPSARRENAQAPQQSVAPSYGSSGTQISL